MRLTERRYRAARRAVAREGDASIAVDARAAGGERFLRGQGILVAPN